MIEQNGRDVKKEDLLYNKLYPIGETPDLRELEYGIKQTQSWNQAIDGNIGNRQPMKPRQERESFKRKKRK